MATLTCGSGAVAGSGMVGTDPFTRVSVEVKPALYWPSLLKQSDVKWLAHTYKVTGSIAGTLSLKMKCNHFLFCCSVAGIEYRHLCWFAVRTTETKDKWKQDWGCISQRAQCAPWPFSKYPLLVYIEFRIESAQWRRAKKPSVKVRECPKFGIISHLKKK